MAEKGILCYYFHMERNNDDIKGRLRNAIEKSSEKKVIKKAYLFGSYARGTSRSDSDVDILIEFDPGETVGFFKFVQIQRAIGESIGKPVDMSTPESLSKHFKDEVMRSAELIYEK